MPRRFLVFRLKNPLSKAVEFLPVIWSWCSFTIFLKGTPKLPKLLHIPKNNDCNKHIEATTLSHKWYQNKQSQMIIIKSDCVKTLTFLRCYNSIPIQQSSIVSTIVCFLLQCAPPEVKKQPSTPICLSSKTIYETHPINLRQFVCNLFNQLVGHRFVTSVKGVPAFLSLLLVY